MDSKHVLVIARLLLFYKYKTQRAKLLINTCGNILSARVTTNLFLTMHVIALWLELLLYQHRRVACCQFMQLK